MKTYHYLSERWFTHASPTLFNAGTPRPQLSSCFLIAMKVCLGPVGLVQSCDHKLDVMHAVRFFLASSSSVHVCFCCYRSGMYIHV